MKGKRGRDGLGGRAAGWERCAVRCSRYGVCRVFVPSPSPALAASKFRMGHRAYLILNGLIATRGRQVLRHGVCCAVAIAFASWI